MVSYLPFIIVKHSKNIRFQFVDNHDNCLQARSSCRSSLLYIGSNSWVHSVQQSMTRLLSTLKFAAKKKRGCSMIVVKAGNATNILNKVDANSWWVGRVHAMRRHNGKQFGVLRHVVDLLARTDESKRRTPNNPHIKVML